MKRNMLLWCSLLIVGMLVLGACTAPPEDAARADVGKDVSDDSAKEELVDVKEVPINKEKSKFEFEGYGPGKSHLGTFKEWEGTLFLDENDAIIGGQGVIQANSVDTGIEGLDAHLKKDDFFNAEKYPTIEVYSTELDGENMKAELTFLGVTKEISFPVTITAESISTDFVLDTSQFGEMNSAANKEVRIAFTMSK